MSHRAPKRRLHVDIKRRWRSRKQENKINTFLDSAYHFDSTNTDEEEINLHVTQEPVIDYSISSEIRTDSDSEFIRNENENNHDDHSIDDTDTSIEDFINQMNEEEKNKTTPLYIGCPISVYEACMRLIRLGHSLNLDKKGIQRLLTEIRMTDNEYRPQVSVRCVECGEVLLKSNDAKCSISYDSNGKYRSYSKVAELAIMNVEREIKRVAERHIDLINEYPKQAPYIFPSDHISSNIYRQLPTNENQCNITIILHSDGAPAVSVNNKSLWPVQAIIAEIPIPVRDMKSAVMLFGVWLAAKKLPRNPLLIPIITQLEVLMRSPIVLKQKDGSRLSYNVRIQQAIFDLPARAHFLNIVQYNGYYGCGDCCIEGVAIGRQVYFPFSKKTEKLKDHQFYLQNAKINDGRFIQGIKGPTPLSSILLLPYQTPSQVWKYFKQVEIDGVLRAKCVYGSCTQTLSIPNWSTSSLIKHLRTVHKVDDLKKSSNGRVATGRVIQKLPKARKKRLDRLALEAIVHDGRSFNDFHRSGLKRFFQYAIPGYIPPHRNTVHNKLQELYAFHYKLMVGKLSNISDIAITTDFWSDKK
ncbi:unnamed protein product, partial [Rotaria magnacalcarata]